MKAILEKARALEVLDKTEIEKLLACQDEEIIEALYETARESRKKYSDNRIFLYGFVYFSTYCRNDCNFCYYRKSNSIERYRKTPQELMLIAKELADSGVHLLDLTMGEDPGYHAKEFEPVLELISEIKQHTGLPVMISPGVVSKEIVDRFAATDVEWYALYQETYNRELFKQLRWDQDYDERMEIKLYARDKGMLIEEGLMTGIGETLSDLADSIIQMSGIGARQLRVMSFVPQKGIPMEFKGTPERSLELKTIALLRLINPTAFIPASLDVDGIAGLKDRLNAGANVVTSIIPPNTGLAGVAQNSMDIDEGSRTVIGVETILKDMGLRAATLEEFRDALK